MQTMNTPLFDLINPDTTILTPNRRLAATLHKQYQTHQLEQQQKCWETPDMLPVSTWIQRLWSEDFSAARLLLNTAQEQFLWEKILTEAKDSSLLLQISETADIAKSAWGLLKQWRIDTHHPLFHGAEDCAALHNWATQFQQDCDEKNLLDTAALTDLICEKIKSSELKIARHIILVGFNELSPQLKYLFNCCEHAGSTVKQLSLSRDNETCVRISLIEQEQEILSMARWAKHIWNDNKSAAIGCVIPSLDKIRDRVLQIFADVFAESDSYTVDPDKSPFNISAGKGLSQYQIINTALQLLSLNRKEVSLEVFSYLLASPFIGDAEYERIRRANFDSALRRENMDKINLAKTIEKSDDKKQALLANHCSKFTKRISRFLELVKEHDGSHTFGEWALIFNQLLSAMGWPGERSLSSEEYQIVESWLKLLNEFMTLDQIAKPVNYHQALQTLLKMASKAVFQPKTPSAPIQVLGILEAAALPFDYLWVAGMDDISWPPQPKPNPFIPKKLQRELNMPHATAERELIYCQQLTTQFKQSAQHVIFSHAEKNEELELQASPLIRDLPATSVNTLALDAYQSTAERIYQTKNIERITDDFAPTLQTDAAVHGGTELIKNQALCPFKTFARHRLHARELEEPVPGLRSTDRGNIIHKILELVWNKLSDHATLMATTHDELTILLDTCINDALTLTPTSRSEYRQFIALEKKRLHKLIHSWLDTEKERAPFKVMTSEKQSEINLGKLNLRLRIDRIDDLGDGKKLIIDYKTGRNNQVNNWFSDRPEEPQLPLYALLDPANTVGITFAQVAQGENCFKGVSKYTLDIGGIKLVSELNKTEAISWDQQLKSWNSTLEKLSDDFYNGVAAVNPKNPPQTCEWCKLKPVCRINEEISA